jgi:hypothetical protein
MISYFSTTTATTPFKSLDLMAVFNLIKEPTDEVMGKIENIRSFSNKEERNRIKLTLPAVTFSGLFRRRAMSDLEKYSGYICIDIDDEVVDLTADPFVCASFISPSGKGIKLIFAVVGGLTHHTQNFLNIQEYLEKKHQVKIDKSCKDVSRLCFLSFDPNIYVSKKPTRFYSPQQFDDIYRKDKNPPVLISPVRRLKDDVQVMIAWWEKNYEYAEGNRNNSAFQLACALFRVSCTPEEVLYHLRVRCHGLPEKELITTRDSANRTTVRQVTFEASPFELASQTPGVAYVPTEPVSAIEQAFFKISTTNLDHKAIKAIFEKLGYYFRHNVMTDLVEVSVNKGNWTPMDDNLELRLWGEIDSLLKTDYKSKKDLSIRLFKAALADSIVVYHPIKEFFALNEWDGVNRLQQLTDCFNDQHGAAEEYIRYFLFGAIEKIYKTFQNPVLVLEGRQKLGKSYFTKWLGSAFPNYYKGEGSIDPTNKDTKIELTQIFIYEWGEAKGMAKRELEALKSLLFTDMIRERPPYGRHPINKYMTASIVLTQNPTGGFLKDTTGNRRFHTLFLRGINHDYSKLDVQQLWLEVFSLWRDDIAGNWKFGIDQDKKTIIDEAAFDTPYIWQVLSSIIEITKDTNDTITTLNLYTQLGKIDKNFNKYNDKKHIDSWFKAQNIDSVTEPGDLGGKISVWKGAAISQKAANLYYFNNNNNA